MILKFAAVALLSGSGTTNAFVPSKRTTRALQLRSSLDRDWDNGDFLSSLSGSPNEIAEANAKYQTQSQNRAQMNEWRLRQMQQQSSTQLNASSSDGGNSSAGGDFGPSPELLKKMGLSGEEDASQLSQQQQNQGPPPGMAPPQQPTQFQGQPQMQQPQQQQQFYDQNGNPVNMPMVYDQNGNLVPYYPPPQQMMQQPVQQQPQVNPVPSFEPAPYEPPLPPTTKERESDGPRPVGYNADAYAVSNTADVYFAQLKQDSRVRKRAWLAGDKETANQVFADESVTSIRDKWVDNPYTKEKNMQEARAEIEGAVRLQMGGDDVEESAKASSGISYKQKLEAIKAKRAGGGAAPTQPQPVVTKPPPPAQINPPAPKMQQPPPPPPVQQKPVAPVQTIPSSPPPPPAMTTPPKPSASEAATSAALPGALAEDEKRRELRTLQGLLLKQRGGPGFGAGRLREPEAQRLENTLGKVMDILRSEDGDFIAGTPAAASPPPVVQAPKPVQPAQPVKPAQPIMQPPPQPVQQMQSTPAPVQSQVDPMTGSIACVEAALKMYQDASPAEREVMMIPLREALMAAASGANKAIAEAELNAHKAAIEAGPPQSMPSMQQEQPMMGFPTTYAVTKADTPVAAAAPPAADTVQRLTNAYNALTDSQGSGKLGLKNLSGNEASALANQVESMRGILLDELNN